MKTSRLQIHGSGPAAVWMIVVTPIPRNAKEAFVTTTVVSCHTDDRTITHSTDHSEGQSLNRPSQRLDLHPQSNITSGEQPETHTFIFLGHLGAEQLHNMQKNKNKTTLTYRQNYEQQEAKKALESCGADDNSLWVQH